MKKRSQSSNSKSKTDGNLVRLQKLLASHGHGSRRACEQFILEGRVEVDGKVVNKLGSRVDPENQKITFDGERFIEQRLEYFMLNKPPGIVSTARDPSGRLRVIDLIKTNSRVYNVGRLDKSSEGLILVTNDGDLANKLTHPRYGIEKKYHVMVKGTPEGEQLKSLKEGIYLAEARVQVSNVTIKKRMRDRTLLEIILDEGRNREIRRILARIGHKVFQLRRVAIGPLMLGELPVGAHRRLTATEVKSLKKAATELGGKKKGPKRKLVKKRVTSKFGAARKGKVEHQKTSRKKATSGTAKRSFQAGAKNKAKTSRKKSSPKSVSGRSRKSKAKR